MNLQSTMNPDRRQKLRMDDVIPVTVRGYECSGKVYRFQTVARDIGAGGLSAFSPRIMRIGERVSLRIRFARPGNSRIPAPEMPVRAMVKRVEGRPDGFCIFAAIFLLR